jgi:hypothetical protein
MNGSLDNAPNTTFVRSAVPSKRGFGTCFSHLHAADAKDSMQNDVAGALASPQIDIKLMAH